MEEIETKEPAMELISAAEDLANAMEKSDFHFRSRKVIEDINNWMIAVSAGTLLWITTNFDKFYLENEGSKEFFYKYLFISISLIILISLIFLIINKFRLDLRNYLIYSSTDSIRSLAEDILKLGEEGATGDELADYCQNGQENVIQEWVCGQNLIDLSLPLLKTGAALYIIGISAFTAYFIYYLINA